MSVRYVVVEGVTGVGKGHLAEMLATRMGARLEVEEPDDNPFLPLFYEDPDRFGFQTQVFYLLNRYRQLQSLHQLDLFRSQVVSTCLFGRDGIYAHVTLGEAELALYERLAETLDDRIPRPDLVIFLQDTVENLARRIRTRGRGYERAITETYLERLSEAYTRFFFHYRLSPLLVVNVSQVDFVNRPEDFEALLEQVHVPPAGTRYYQPTQVSV
ncbi:MAG: deoxynucleoside kinase [Gemmatimonadetes bacterium]|nr:deoxynucleoside kinase [Gemmatimonadota bacterium]